MVRLKTRYLLVHIYYPHQPTSNANAAPLPELLRYHVPTHDSLTPPVLLAHLRRTIASLFGDLGAGLVSGPGSLTVKYLSTATSTFVLRCPRAWVRLVWASLAFTTALPSNGGGRSAEEEDKCVLRVLRVSGALRKIEYEILKRDRGLCRVLKAHGRDGLAQEGLGALSVDVDDEEEDDEGEEDEEEDDEE